MLAKLAFRNIRRSVKDYGVYFVTLVFGVAVFYAFNSVSSQSILFDLEDTASASVFEMTGQFLGMFSVLIACVLGFLVLYANGFLIRRRKQEFGTYLMLGMNPRSVSAIVLMETAAVGLVSLVVGLALGFALSQGLSFVTAGLFNIQMTQYRFVFSLDAFLLTLMCFALIFVVTALFNTLSIRRYKLIDLLSARSRNARFRVRNPWISLVAFVAAVGILAWAYLTLVDNGLVYFDDGFWEGHGAHGGRHVSSLLVARRLRHRGDRAHARRVLPRPHDVHDAPDSQQGEHGVRVAFGGVHHAVLLAHGVLHRHGPGARVHRQHRGWHRLRRHAHGERVPERGRHARSREARAHERGGSRVPAGRRREGRRPSRPTRRPTAGTSPRSWRTPRRSGASWWGNPRSWTRSRAPT
ncbi:MAG: ABC transporter permease [Gordonibacter pamelaeae]